MPYPFSSIARVAESILSVEQQQFKPRAEWTQHRTLKASAACIHGLKSNTTFATQRQGVFLNGMNIWYCLLPMTV